MKKLLAMLLFCANAYAGEYFVAQTEAGGEIILTLEKVSTCQEALFFMYVVSKDQRVVYGCWAYINDKIHVRYDDGTRRVYDTTGWVHKKN